MKFGIAHWGGETARLSSRWISSYIAASRAVNEDLIALWRPEISKIEIVHEFGQPNRTVSEELRLTRSRMRARYGISESATVVGMCGTLGWRKGADLFPILARAVAALASGLEYRFVWVGAQTSSTEYFQLMRDIETLGLDNMSIVGEVQDTQPYLSMFDLFTLTSREDPCPLAMLEAAALEMPILCFAHSGGAPDFVSDDAGIVVPYLDIAGMARAVVDLASADRRKPLGVAGKKRALASYSLLSQAPKLRAVIERSLLVAANERH
jgi:glycosyltransferase involved in cell wall biosynthesis